MDFTADAELARFGFALGWHVASQSDLAGWQPGDEFEKSPEEFAIQDRIVRLATRCG